MYMGVGGGGTLGRVRGEKHGNKCRRDWSNESVEFVFIFKYNENIYHLISLTSFSHTYFIFKRKLKYLIIIMNTCLYLYLLLGSMIFTILYVNYLWNFKDFSKISVQINMHNFFIDK